MNLQGKLFKLAAVGFCIAALSGSAFAEDDKKKDEKPKFEPGKAVSIEIKGTTLTDAEDSKWIVYLPTNYDASRKWPMFFCFHGLNGTATISPIVELTKGRDYIIIGCPYYMRGLDGYAHFSKDVANVKVVMKYISSQLEINSKLVFVGGFSKGGFYSCNMLCAHPKMWAGGMILGGGWGTEGVANAKALKGKPIFLGCGTADDVHYKTAEEANSKFTQLGANITYERWKDVGHNMPPDTSMMQKWLLYQGPLRNAKNDMANAAKLRKAKPGKALVIYRNIAGASDTEEVCKTAAKAVKEITEQAENEAKEADKLLADKEYVQAATLLVKLSQKYEGSEFGAQAEEKLAKLKSDKEIQAIIKQAELNARADALEERAKEAEGKKRYAEAIRLYELYVKNCVGADNYAKVKKHLEELKADKKIASATEDEEASKECKKWLSMADNYINAGMYAEARKYLDKIIAKYKGTKWAKEAADRLEKIKDK